MAVVARGAPAVNYKAGEKFIVKYRDEAQWRELYYLLPCTTDRVGVSGQSYVQHTDGSYTLANHSLWAEHIALNPNSLDYPAAVGVDEVSAFAELPSDELLSNVIRGAIVDRNAKEGLAGYENMVALPETRLNPLGVQVAMPRAWRLLGLGRAPPPPAAGRAVVQVSACPPAIGGFVWVVSEVNPAHSSSLGTVVVREEIVVWHEDRGVANVGSLTPGAANYTAAVRKIADSELASFVTAERTKYSSTGPSPLSGLLGGLGLGPDGSKHFDPAQSASARTGPPAAVQPVSKSVDETQVWVVAFSSSVDHPVGAIVTMSGSDAIVGRLGIWSDQSGVGFFVERIKVSDLVGYADRRAALPTSGKGKGTDDVSKTEGKSTDEVRTLWIDIDDQEERFKEWRKVCAESTDERFVDWPLEGPSTALFWCKHAQRFGGNPRLWLAEFIRAKKLETTDRSVHELTLLCDVMWYAGTYDQLNVGGLAALEAIVRRINTITDAHAVAGGKPNWSRAKYFSGSSSIDDGVCPAMRTHIARKQREEKDHSGRGPADTSGGGQGDGAEVGLPGLGKDKSKGGGKGK